MKSKDPADPMQASGGQKILRPFSGLFSRLEAEADLSPKSIPPSGQRLRGTDQHGGVGVVAAGVHFSVYLAAIVRLMPLLHGQCVDVRTERDDRSRTLSSGQRGQNTGGSNAPMGDTGFVQLPLDDLGGVMLFQCQLRITMQLPSQGGEGGLRNFHGTRPPAE